MRILLMAVVCGVLTAARVSGEASDEGTLMGAYLQSRLVHLVGTQMDEWSEGAGEAAAGELESALDEWQGALKRAMVKKLNARFGGEEKAKAKLTAFVAGFTQAEKAGDKDYLRRMASRLKLEDPPPADYAAFRQAALQAALADELNEASAFLGSVETWLGRKAKGEEGLPPLGIWLDATFYNPPPPPPANALAQAEAGLGSFTGDPDDNDNPFEDYRAARAAKRKRAAEQAREGMALVAGERQAAEQEAAAKKLAAAQAEAAALQKHAEKLAAVEAEALEQRKNSWSSKLKNIVASTISTATGVFMGSVGQRAGEAVTDAVFDNK